MTPLTRAVADALLHFIWQGALVAIAGWLALWLLRRRSANARYAVACAALALLVLLPVITTWALYDHPFAARRGAAVLAPLADLPTFPAPAFDWLTAVRSWAVPVWACGVLFFALRMAWGCAQVATLRRRGDSAAQSLLKPLANRLGVTRPVRLIVSTIAESPAVVGWLRPVILLPAAAVAGLAPDQLEAILAHELAHIRRHDYLVNLLQMTAESLLFYHPAVWWVSARIRQERELCCDDLAAPVCGGAIVYARALTALEKMRPPETTLALAANSGSLLYRVRRLVLGDAECAPSRLSGVVAISVAALCLVLSVSWAHAQETPPPPPPKPNAEELRRLAVAFQLVAEQARLAQAQEELRSLALQRQIDQRNQAALTQSFLNDELADARKKLDALSQNADSRQLDQARQWIEEVQKRVRISQQAVALEQTRESEIQQLQARRDEVKRELEVQRARMTAQMNAVNATQLQLMTLESQLNRIVNSTGRKLTRIEFKDVSEKDADALRIRLPIREGERFTNETFNKIYRTVHEVNPDLRFSLSRDGDDLVVIIQPR